MSKKPKSLKCCVCGGSAGVFLQHWNRDTGWGVCRSCVDWEISRGIKPKVLLDLYGVAGVNYEARQYITFGRSFNVLAAFPNTEAGATDANRYMLAHSYAALICGEGDELLLADKDDHGRIIEVDSFRAAYMPGADSGTGGGTLLTTEEDAGLPDDELIASAIACAKTAGIEISESDIVIGEWRD